MEILFSIVLSIITGAYSGLVVAKYYEFRAIREEVCRIVYSRGSIKDWNEKLMFLSASLVRLNYKQFKGSEPF